MPPCWCSGRNRLIFALLALDIYVCKAQHSLDMQPRLKVPSPVTMYLAKESGGPKVVDGIEATPGQVGRAASASKVPGALQIRKIDKIAA